MRYACAALVCLPLLAGEVTSDRKAALQRITAKSLRGHVSFLASDLLEGRSTPSRGLDVAAEYIAAQFRRAGLEPPADGSFFQTARWRELETDKDGAEVILQGSDWRIRVDLQAAAIRNHSALDRDSIPAVAVREAADLAPANVTGKVAVVTGTGRGVSTWIRQLSAMEPPTQVAAILWLHSTPLPPQTAALVDPALPAPPALVRVSHPEAGTWAGRTDTVTLRLPAPRVRDVTLRNVAGLLPGSDRELARTVLLVTAHYDHLGVRATGNDRIFNGANDDASGVAAVLELASSLAELAPRPRRSILFAAWFGEERGLLGARYYARNPLIPLRDTIGNLNLEQLGRTDSDDGPQMGRLFVTGFRFSTLPAMLAGAAAGAGVEVLAHPRHGDTYFEASDNLALAEAGVPAHTAAVTFGFPDYHAPGDHWEKLDYDNFATVTQALALGVLALADSGEAARWDESESRNARFREAWKRRHGPPPRSSAP